LEELSTTIAAEHCELLKLRLAAERLLADLARSLPGDSWQQALAETQALIANHYRRREARLADHRVALVQLHEQVTLAHRQLTLERQQHQRQRDSRPTWWEIDDAA
jgi:hypothetical protein